MTAESRPDHGPTQVRSIEELKVENLYIHHAPVFGPEESAMRMVQLLSLPAQSGIHTGIYPAATYIMLIRTFFEWNIKQTLYERNISLPEIGLAKYPGNPGEWDPYRWLEDPLKMEGGHSNITQIEALEIIKNRMRPNRRNWDLSFPLPF